ncbi:MAG: prolipoprotein diacylglyceryl transferase [bacterium]|nr:prolipoprotein diacylglyceryl transferase [bacterium]
MFLFNFLHTFNPSPILISLGPIHVYWYGFFIVLGVLAALTVTIRLAKFYQIKTDTIIDLALWLVVGGIMGARIYDIFLEWPYFSAHPLDILKIWQGGLAIHGAIIGGLIALWLFVKKYSAQVNFWQLAAIFATVLPLAQAIGRWGNYFNQELFGYPTNLPWGIPIDMTHRPWQYLNSEYFHPAFLYESLGNLLIFLILLSLQIWLIKKSRSLGLRAMSYELCVVSYAIFYSLLRFSMEFIRIDPTPVILGWRLPQLASFIIIIACLIYLGLKFGRQNKNNPALEK